MNATWDIIVVGAGAAGLASGIFAAETGPGLRIALVDSAKHVGAKILVSGGSRCNVTHDHVTEADFNAPPHIVRHVLAAFDEHAAVQWFESLGVTLKREPTGKLFPVTDDAHTVLNALTNRCDELGVPILAEHRISAVERVEPDAGEPYYRLLHDRGAITARRIIMATGGKSLPKTGSDGHGWSIVQSLGHSVTPTHPALVPLVLAPTMFHARISGLSLNVTLSTFAAGKQIDRRTGSMLWTHFGVSGPVVMDASRHWVIASAAGLKPQIKCSLVPDMDFAQVDRMLTDAAGRQPRRPVANMVSDFMPARMAHELVRHAAIDPATLMGQLPREQRRTLVHHLTALELPVERDRGWNYAEVTAGGVPVNEIDHRTMASRKSPGLYLVGEILDCDGRIGGFNFQWAWSTGHLAGIAAAKSIV